MTKRIRIAVWWRVIAISLLCSRLFTGFSSDGKEDSPADVIAQRTRDHTG